jgi:hypothetical protein
MNKLCLLLVIALLAPFILHGQGNEIIEQVDFEKVIERLLPQQEIELDYNDVYDRLFSLYTNPMNLNTATRSEL